MGTVKVKNMLRSDDTLGLDPICEVPGSDNGWRTYVAYPVPRSVVDSFELAMGMRMQARELAQKYMALRSNPRWMERPKPHSEWTV